VPRAAPSSSPTTTPLPRDAAAWIADTLGDPVVRQSGVSSSSWSSAYTFHCASGARYFVKTSRSPPAMFEAEAAGLTAMASTGAPLRIPRVYGAGGTAAGGSFIVMEQLDLGGGRGGGGRPSQRALGEGLARMHLAPPSDPTAAAGSFGFAVDNTIGGTPQPNGWCDDWVEFFAERRLRHMLRLLNRPALTKPGEIVASRLGDLFEGVVVRPALIHGDLWSGNVAVAAGDDGGEAQWSLLDPAVYYGHHEAEWGMSWCASFGPDFWAGYRSLIPEDPGFGTRRRLYEAYHKLNHGVLFGGGYISDAQGLLEGLARTLAG
jgi:fructosamine-3-kinase